MTAVTLSYTHVMVTSQMQIAMEVLNPKYGRFYLEQKDKKSKKNPIVLGKVRGEIKENKLQQEAEDTP